VLLGIASHFFGTTTIDFFASGGFEKVEKSNLRQNN